jgi:glycosyltransferase involved in cell wall biosynthesis
MELFLKRPFQKGPTSPIGWRRSKSLKILQVGKYYSPFRGGVESMVQGLSEGLAKKDVEVTVLCASHEGEQGEEIIEGVKVIREKRYTTLFSQPITPGLLKDLHKLCRSMDLVHVHSPNPMAEFFTLFIPPEIPVVVTYHSDIIRQKILGPLYRPALRAFLNRANTIVVPTLNHIKYSNILHEYAAKCQVIPFGVDDTPFEATYSIKKKASELHETYGDFVLFVGRLVEYKGLEYLIEAMKNVNAQACLVGKGPLKLELQKQIQNLRLEERVHLLTVDDNETLNAYYHACALFALPSVTPNENFGIVQLEAMHCGRPIVTTDLKSGVPAVGDRDVTCRIVPPRSSEALSLAINELLENELLRSRFGKAAKEKASRLYTLNAMVTSYHDLYLDLLGPALSPYLQKVA